MKKLEWEKMGDLHFARVDENSGYTIEHDMDTKREGWRWTFTTYDEWLLCDTLKDAKSVCQSDYDDRVEKIAAANGYVRLEPGQVVVDAAEVGDALDALCDTCAGECSICRVKDVLSAIKEARDE